METIKIKKMIDVIPEGTSVVNCNICGSELAKPTGGTIMTNCEITEEF